MRGGEVGHLGKRVVEALEQQHAQCRVEHAYIFGADVLFLDTGHQIEHDVGLFTRQPAAQQALFKTTCRRGGSCGIAKLHIHA